MLNFIGMLVSDMYKYNKDMHKKMDEEILDRDKMDDFSNYALGLEEFKRNAIQVIFDF